MAGLRVRDLIVLVVDMQARLLPAIVDTEALVGRCAALAQAASLLGVPVVGTEHCADKIGATAPAMAAWISRVVHKPTSMPRANPILPRRCRRTASACCWQARKRMYACYKRRWGFWRRGGAR